VLNLCRLAAALRPSVLIPARCEDGRTLFKLKALAEANGIVVPGAHEAMADVITMHRLCVHVMNGAPEIWSQFLRFSQKAAVEAFIRDEDAFIVSETVGNLHRTRAVTRIGGHSSQANRHYCYDLTVPIGALRSLSDSELAKVCAGSERPIVSLRTNAAPTLWSLDDASDEHLSPLDEAEVLRRAAALHQDGDFIARLKRAAQASEKVYPASPHVEEQLYDKGFPPAQDEAVMENFHSAEWPERVGLIGRFVDDRYQRLAQRLVFFERPDLLQARVRNGINAEIARRLLADPDNDVPWLTTSAALEEANRLAAGDPSFAWNLKSYAQYLLSRQEELRGRHAASAEREEMAV
jgi:exodeoxyribonuclease-1